MIFSDFYPKKLLMTLAQIVLAVILFTDITDMNAEVNVTVARIPDEIKSFRPGPCTEVKCISGHYYVYMYSSFRLPSGNWGRKTGKSIGTIIPGTGFVPNRNYPLYTGAENADACDEITVIEYGQYALVEAVAKDILDMLETHFQAQRARQIFSYASILYVNDFVHLDQVASYYEQSWLSLENAEHTFKMGKMALGGLLRELGMRTNRVANYERGMIEASSSKIAIDGHAIRSCSDENDLAEARAKFGSLGEDQVNLLMGYDIERGMPLFARMYRGACNDKSTIGDLAGLLLFKGILFIVDRGFYSKGNLDVFAANGNTYIIPVPSNTEIFRMAMGGDGYADSFCHCGASRRSRIEYRKMELNSKEYPGASVYVFRDVEENERCRFNYMHCLELGKGGYTQKGYEASKEFFGVYVLMTNGGMSPKEVFENYKGRWGIETFYQYVRNVGDFNDLMVQDYYKEQGMSFVMLVAGQIHQRMVEAVRKLKCNTISTRDLLLMARRMKLEKKGKFWTLKNTRKKDLQLLAKIGFAPLDSYAARG